MGLWWGDCHESVVHVVALGHARQARPPNQQPGDQQRFAPARMKSSEGPGGVSRKASMLDEPEMEMQTSEVTEPTRKAHAIVDAHD